MSVLTTARLWFGLDPHPGAPSPTVTYVPTLEEKQEWASENRGDAFDLISEAEAMLRAAAQTEAEVAEESVRRSDNALRSAQEAAQRALDEGFASAARHDDRARVAGDNAVKDAEAAEAMRRLYAEDPA